MSFLISSLADRRVLFVFLCLLWPLNFSLIHIDAQDAQDFSENDSLVILSIRNPAPDHCRSQLLVQQRPVLLFLCIDVQLLVLTQTKNGPGNGLP